MDTESCYAAPTCSRFQRHVCREISNRVICFVRYYRNAKNPGQECHLTFVQDFEECHFSQKCLLHPSPLEHVLSYVDAFCDHKKYSPLDTCIKKYLLEDEFHQHRKCLSQHIRVCSMFAVHPPTVTERFHGCVAHKIRTIVYNCFYAHQQRHDAFLLSFAVKKKKNTKKKPTRNNNSTKTKN